MKFSYNWLKEISKTEISPEKMADQLMMHSFEVENVEKKGEGLENIVAGKILEISKHPDADRLQLVKVDLGGKRLDIVCGANNIKVDDKVPVAMVGTKLPGGIEIKEAEIRGVKSFGMLCAQDELGVGKDHSGIMILEKNAKIGEKISDILGLNDSIFEIKVLPDRGHDALSHVGMAKEIAVLNNKKIDPYYEKIKLSAKKTSGLKIEIKDKALCPRYIGAILDNIKIQDSPHWAKQRLLSLGVKPINNVVDATNLVMLELGQPLHAFDYNAIKSEITNSKSQISNKNQASNVKIIVRKARDNEEIKLLDGTVKTLSAEDLVIANDKKALALAGIMGGEDSGINDGTKSIVLESASFNAVSIRRSRTKLNLKTEASDRYEKGIDPNLCETAMARVIGIIESFDAKLDGINDNYPGKVKSWQIKLDLEYVNKLLGEKITPKEIVKILSLLGMVVSGKGKTMTVKIPTIRMDLRTQEDLIEEIGRINGYEKIKSQAPVAPIQAANVNENREFERMAKNILASNGFSEIYNYSFYSTKDAESANLSEAKHLKLENPMNPEQALLRTSLIPGILKNVKENLKNFDGFRIFEIGRAYHPGSDNLPEEKNMLVGAMVLEKDKKAESFFELKGYVDAIFEKIGINSHYFDSFECAPNSAPSPLWHSARCSEIKIEGQEKNIGYLGEVNPLVLANFDIRKKVTIFEFDMEKLKESSELEREFTPIGKYPVSSRDISMIAGSDIRVDDILKSIQKSGGNLVLDVDLFDIFDFEEKKETSFAFRIIFGSDDRTLQNKEIDSLMELVIKDLERELKVKVRK